jgi:hypothetical protein
MSSKLFHTIVGVGIALGVASLGCSNAAEEPVSSGEGAMSYTGTDPTSPPANPTPPATDPGALCDAFDDTSWPTTKGGHHHPPPPPPPACIDPTGVCTAHSQPFDCTPVNAAGACTFEGGSRFYYSVCVDGAWQCKPGKKKVDDCTCWDGDPACASDSGTPKP